MTVSALVVDDDETIRETLSEFLRALGHTVRSASTATDARRAAAVHACDVALIDLRLPDADGLRLLEALRADDPDIGVIVLTGHADLRTAVRAMPVRGDPAGLTEFRPLPAQRCSGTARPAASFAWEGLSMAPGRIGRRVGPETLSFGP